MIKKSITQVIIVEDSITVAVPCCAETKAPGVSSVKLRGNATVKHALDIIQKASNEHGLRAADIDSLVDAVIDSKFRV